MCSQLVSIHGSHMQKSFIFRIPTFGKDDAELAQGYRQTQHMISEQDYLRRTARGSESKVGHCERCGVSRFSAGTTGAR